MQQPLSTTVTKRGGKRGIRETSPLSAIKTVPLQRRFASPSGTRNSHITKTTTTKNTNTVFSLFLKRSTHHQSRAAYFNRYQPSTHPDQSALVFNRLYSSFTRGLARQLWRRSNEVCMCESKHIRAYKSIHMPVFPLISILFCVLCVRVRVTQSRTQKKRAINSYNSKSKKGTVKRAKMEWTTRTQKKQRNALSLRSKPTKEELGSPLPRPVFGRRL
jgi:hypothetical protein